MRAAPFGPPQVEEVATAQRFPEETAGEIAALLEEEGELVHISADIYLHRHGIEEAKRLLRDHLEREGPMTASQAKTWLGSSRKFVIPLLEYLDKQGFTVRRGDLRELRKKV
jgi:selenocysteine-specific elongation factor